MDQAHRDLVGLDGVLLGVEGTRMSATKALATSAGSSIGLQGMGQI